MLSIFTLNTYQGYSHQHQVDSIEWHDAIQIIPLGMTISELFTVDDDKRLENTWNACGMRQDNSRFFRSPFLVRCHFEQLNLFGKNTSGKRIFGGLLTLVLSRELPSPALVNGMAWFDPRTGYKSSQTCYLLSYPLYLRSNPLCGIAKSRNDWE